MNDPHTLPDALTEARANAHKMRTALERATAHAAQTEIARADAEAKHCSAVADSLVEDGKPPSKPAALSALQSADIVADQALAEIELRVRQADGAVHSAAYDLSTHAINALVSSRASEARQSLATIVAAFKSLIAACGLSNARHVLDVLSRLPFADNSNAEICAIASEIPEIQQLGEAYKIRAAEMRVVPQLCEIEELLK